MWKDILESVIIYTSAVVLGLVLIGILYGTPGENPGSKLEIAVTGEQPASVILEFDSTKDNRSTQIFYHGEDLWIDGRINHSRGYFDGNIKGPIERLVLTEGGNGEAVTLRPSLLACTLGDYYITCTYQERRDETRLLILYCPAS